MTYQSLYRRFRPQTFADMVGQEHVSDTLRNAVRTDRVAHAYLFCGPRGCGKTTSARILAKALNCTNLQDGEPCCACESCVNVAAGSSMDVIELDAASNNGVDTMRDLVSRASLGTAGRRKVYILDEVHMLSTAASNTLLKTLEEPPPHVVFVLCTTDPQKVLPTIRSRTQVFEFRLFALDALTALVRDVAEKAGLGLDDATLVAVAKRGNGSARDALSALDSVAASGGVGDAFDITELAAAVGARHVGAVLTAVDRAMERGRDPRQLVRDLIEVLREVFLAHMGLTRPGAPDDLVRAFTPAASTRALELLGETLVAQRDAIDPRIVLETSLVRLANPELDTSPAAIIERLDRVERLLRSGVSAPGPAPGSVGPVGARESTPTTAVDVVAVVDRTADATGTVPAVEDPLVAATVVVQRADPAETADSADTAAAAVVTPMAPSSNAMPSLASTIASAAPSTGSRRSGVADGARAQLGGRPAPSRPATRPPGVAVAAPAPPVVIHDAPPDERDEVLQQLRGKARAMFSAGRFTTLSPSAVEVALPNAMHLGRCQEFVPDLVTALTTLRGQPVAVALVVDPNAGAPVADAPDAIDMLINRRFASAPAVAAVPRPAEPALQEDHEVDLGGLVDASGPAPTALDHIARTFPGAELVADA